MYLVTGGAGFIGSHIVKALVERGEKVRVLDNLFSGKKENLPDSPLVELIVGDINDPAAAAAFDGCEVVFHQAALASVERSVREPAETERINVAGTINVLNNARRSGVRRVIIAGSASVYGGNEASLLHEDLPAAPLSPYAVSKYACEHYARCFSSLFHLETVVLRYFNVYGPNQDPHSDYSGVISIFMERMLAGQNPVIFGDGEQTRDFVYAGDVARANLLAAASPRVGGGEVINIAGGESISINRLVMLLNRILGTNLAPVYREARPGDVRFSRADLSRAAALLDYRPTVSFDEGLRRLAACCREAYARRGHTAGRDQA